MSNPTSWKPLVSIVIPFHQSYALYFQECLDSVRQQTYTNWEAIVVDDASPREEVAREIVKTVGDPRVSLIRHEHNRGQAAARNSGIRICNGEFVMPVDCDDILATTHLQNLVLALGAHPESNLAYADYRLFSGMTGDVQFPVHDVCALLQEQWIPHPGTVYKRSLWDRVGGYCEHEIFRVGNEDWDFFLSIAEVDLHTVRVPEPSYFYRQHATSISSSRFLYSDYLTREFIYVRHQKLFDSFGMKGRFLADGYRLSAKAFWNKGDRWRALKLFVRAVYLSPERCLTVFFRILCKSAHVTYL